MQESILTEQEQAYPDKRRCSKCKNWLTLDQFRERRGTYDSWCRTCHNAHSLAKYHADPNKREKRLKANLKFMYGISVEEYSALLESQEGVCAICKQAEKGIDSRTNEPRRLRVDHNHKTGEVRGLLCDHCNTALGFLEKKFDYLDSIIAYLQKP